AAGQSSAAGVTVDLTPLLVVHSLGLPHGSNELIVDAAHSAAGHPIAVFGPQTGYFVPQLLHEIDLHGPGLQARGVSFSGFNRLSVDFFGSRWNCTLLRDRHLR